MRSRKPKDKTATNYAYEDVYTENNISGTLVGFWFPDHLLNLGVPGFHFHFISDDKKLSGHVLNLSAKYAEYAIKNIDSIELHFLNTEKYKKAAIKMA